MKKLEHAIFKMEALLFAEILLKSICFGLAAYFISNFLINETVFSVGAGILFFAISGFFMGLFKSPKSKAINTLHLKNKHLEYATALIFKENKNTADELQLDRITDTKIKYSYRGFLSIIFIAIIPLLAWGLNLIPVSKEILPLANEVKTIIPKPIISTKDVKLISSTVFINPPTYTRLSAQKSEDFNIVAYIGSTVTWNLDFEAPNGIKVLLENAKGQKVIFTKKNNVFTYKDQLTNSGFYTIKATINDSLVYQSEYFKIEALPDLPPKINISSKELVKYHYLKDKKQLNISAELSDDFLVKQTFLTATVARGSGENVKFRELRIPISASNFKSQQINKTLDLKALKFSPGDELYYYWTAVDNKWPEPNITKSDTYFVIYKDTAAVDDTELATMAMNIMPEYFRSQRQIIIDTEKLLKQKSKMTKEAFNSASNEIGFDQKVLRLKYGQYLGEEFENSIGGGGIPEEATSNEDMLKGFVHAHDSEDHQDEPQAHQHDDHSNVTTESANIDPLAAMLADYVHSHDDGEMNTFYEQSTRSLLKSALEQMWQSELYLRTYAPEKALPFENQALLFLKEAQQKARAYVKKSGFDPPPIKEKEKRLTGELSRFSSKANFGRNVTLAEFEKNVKEVIGFVEEPKLTDSQRQSIISLGQQLSVIVLNGKYSSMDILSQLQKLANKKSLSKSEIKTLKTKLLQLTYQDQNTTTHTNESGKVYNKSLKAVFLKKLEK